MESTLELENRGHYTRASRHKKSDSRINYGLGLNLKKRTSFANELASAIVPALSGQ